VEWGVAEFEKRDALNDLIDLFLRGFYDSFDLSFGIPPELYENELKKLVEGYVSSNTTVNGDVFIDEYIYDIGYLFCDEDEESDNKKCHLIRKHLVLRYHKDADEFGVPVYLIVGASGRTEDIVKEETE
jgi:hypothetical protein